MNKILIVFLFCCGLLTTGSGCIRKNSNQEGTVSGNTPSSLSKDSVPEQTLRAEVRDIATPPVRLQIEDASGIPEQATLSQFISDLSYHRLGEAGLNGRIYDDRIFSVPNGYIADTYNGVMLFTKDWKPVRRLIESNISLTESGGMKYLSPTPLSLEFYSPANEMFYCAVFDSTKNLGDQWSTGWLPLQSLLERSSVKIGINEVNNKKQTPLWKTFGGLDYTFNIGKSNRDEVFRDSIITVNLQGDTLCRFSRLGIDTYTPPRSSYNSPGNGFQYALDNKFYCIVPYCDTVFRFPDPYTIQAAYVVDFGKRRLSASAGISLKTNLENSHYLTGWKDTDKYIFIQTNHAFQVYDKESKKLISLKNTPESSSGIINDIDGGVAFWPTVYLDGQLIMVVRGKELKEMLPLKQLNVSSCKDPAKKELLKKILTSVGDKEYILISAK